MKFRELVFCFTPASEISRCSAVFIRAHNSQVTDDPGPSASGMRCVDFARCTRFAAPKGNLNTNGIALGDVDGDGDQEFIIGNIQGDLAIFKYNLTSLPRYRSHGLGTITAIAIGNRFHGEAIDDKCTMLVINAEGVCHEFRIPTIDRDCYELAVEPVNNWPVPVNISRAVISDGTLIVGRTDRIIHLYRLDSDTNQLIQTAMYVFPGQLGTIVPLSVPNRSESIIFVAQPGAPIYLRFRICHYIGGVFSTLSPDDGNIESFPASAANATADILATEMAITTSRDELVLCTMGGQMRFFHLSSRRMRSVALDQQLFALASLPYSKQPQQHRNPIVACAWNGDTFIVDGQTLDVVKFQFGERVCAFTAGMFAVSPSMNKPCLFFVDFNDSIVCYDNIQVLSDNNDNKGDKSMHKIRVIQR